MLFLGIDSGTQSTKVLLVDEGGDVVGRGSSPHESIAGLPVGHKEQHPHQWIDALRFALAAALRAAKASPRDIAAIGVSGQQHGLVPLDARGTVIRPAKLWCDTSTAAEAAAIMERAGGRERFMAMTGNALPAGFTASKIEWMRVHEPEDYARMATVLLPHDYLNHWLTGERRMEWGDASGTGLMDVRSRAWCAAAIDAIDPALAGKLPALSPSWEPCGRVRPEIARELALAPGVLVASGGGDNMMGAIGTGNVVPGVVTVSLGTSGTIFACNASPVTDEHGEIAAFCDSTGNWLPLLCTMNVTVATELTKSLFVLSTDELNTLAASVDPGSEGLMLLPYFEGERTPDVPDGTGVWFGMTMHNATRAHFARAAMEGATMGLGYGLARLRELGVNASQVRLTGGGSKSGLWRHILADVFDAEVVCTEEPEGAAFGAAMQAAWIHARQRDSSASLADIARDWVSLDPATRCEPHPANVERYRECQAVYNALSRALRPVFPAHRGLVAG